MSIAIKTVPVVVLCALIVAVPSIWASWVQDGVALCTATGNQNYPMIAPDGAGGAIVTWMDSRSGNYDVYAQRLKSGAVQWAADGVALCTAAGGQSSPTIASDGSGGAIVTWHDYRGGNWDIYAQRMNASGAIQWAENGVALCKAAGDQQFPQIISDGAGGAIVAWTDNRSVGSDIYAQKVDASGAVKWTAGGVALCAAALEQANPRIASDGSGGAVVAWQDLRGEGDPRIYTQSVDASGAIRWPEDGIDICTAAGEQRNPTIVGDGAGGAIVAWLDGRAWGAYHIYAQRVDASGAIRWTANGAAICTAGGSQDSPMVTTDDAGGAIVTWSDGRLGENWNIFSQRVDASGTVQWRTDGVPICMAPGRQESPQITSDGAGGAIITWPDFRIWLDIYAQKVSASGAVQWTVDGVAVCAAVDDQQYPQITSDGSNGAIITWGDYRNGSDRDIYAQKVDANGFVPLTDADAPAVSVELRQNYPNPFNPVTTVAYSIAAKCEVTLEIYDASGKCLARLVDKQQEKGSYAVQWNGKDERGSRAASGIYFYRLTAGGRTIAKKMVLLR